jgi:hypothetical protein
VLAEPSRSSVTTAPLIAETATIMPTVNAPVNTERRLDRLGVSG